MAPTRYLAIADALAAELAQQAVGFRIPSEHDIARRFEVGRSAARAAVGELEDRGLVRRVQGAGTFIHRPAPLEVSWGGPMVWEQGAGAARAQVRTVRAGALPAGPAATTGLAPGAPALRASIGLFRSDTPIGSAVLWMTGPGRTDLAAAFRTHGALPAGTDAMGVRLVYGPAEISQAVGPTDTGRHSGTRLHWRIDAALTDARTGTTTGWTRTELRADQVIITVRVGACA